MTRIVCDVAVVGAGPGGVAAAISLADRGYEVALFDRAAFPRDKACGEFLNPGALALLGQLGIEVDGGSIERVRLFARAGDAVEIALIGRDGSPAPGRSIPRVDLDARLLSFARSRGVAVYERHAVRGLLADGGVEGDGFRVDARAVVGADGTHSVLARQLGLVRPLQRLMRVGIAAHFEGAGSQHSVDMLSAYESGLGVAGACGQSDGRAVMSMVVSPSIARDWSGRIDDLAVRRSVSFPWLREARLTRTRTTACFGHRLERPFADRILFVGDAARFVDPFTGEGMHHAIEGGILAAEALDQALRKGNLDAQGLAGYGVARRELEGRYLLSDAVQFLAHRPRLLAWVAAGLHGSPRQAEKVIGSIVNIFKPQDAIGPLLQIALMQGRFA